MKVSFVSTQAISQALRYQMLRMQPELIKAQKELVTGRFADVGLSIGAKTGLSVSLHREVDRLRGLIDSNQLAASRLQSTQLGMQKLTDATQQLLEAFTTAMNTTSDPAIAKHEADAVLATLTSVLNTNVGGEHLFAGINTDVKPLYDFQDPASPNRVAFETAFDGFFGFPPNDPAAAAILAPDMEDFLAIVEAQFMGPDWNTNWSTATDQQITSRITLTETAQTSVSANIDGFRKLAMAAATVSSTFDGPLSGAARNAVLSHALKTLGQAVSQLASQQSLTGITEQRIESATERMSMQVDLFRNSLFDLEGIDESEAATRVTGLLAQIELSYSLTARMQQLSLLRYL